MSAPDRPEQATVQTVHERLSAPLRGVGVARSLFDGRAIADLVEGGYGVHSIGSAVLLRRFVNDVYVVDAQDARYIFKMYRPEWRDASAILWEIDLLEHLSRLGAPVAAAISRADGRSITVIQAPEGERYGVLFEFAEGRKPEEPFTAELYFHFGHAAGIVHDRSAEFVSPYPRRPLDLTTLIDEPLSAMEPFLASRPEERAYVRGFGARLRARIQALADAGLDCGVCHHDMSLDNLHVTADNRVTFYDFDSGGPGWRSLDFQGIYACAPNNRNDLWDAFLRGYSEVRELSAADLEAIPYFVLACALWSTHADIIRSRWDGTSFLTDKYFSGRIGWWRQWETERLE